MPEEQKPFIHQAGAAIPPKAVSDLLKPGVLAGMQVMLEAFEKAGMVILRDDRAAALKVGIELAKLLRHPTLNATLSATVLLEPSDQALVSDVATLLHSSGNRRHRVVAELRALLEKLS